VDVTPGYKQSEVGVIPVDWNLVELDSVCSMKSGEAITSERIDDSSQYPCYGGNGLRGFTSRFTHDGTFALIGRQGALCGNVAIAQGKFFASEHAVVVTPRTGNDIGFLTYVLSDMHLNRYSESSAQPGLSVSKVKKLPLAIPSNEAEQRAIATALSDVDALLDGLQRLIAKQRDLKQGAMQQLLTGKTRLPGFHGEWEMKKIGEFTDCTAGGTPSTRVATYWGGAIRWMSSGELNLKRVNEVDGRITEAGLNNSSAKMLPTKCVLIGLAGQGKTRGTVAMNFVELCTNQSIAAVLPRATFVPEYLYYNLESRYEELRELSTGAGGRGGLNLSIIKAIEVSFPTVPEQSAIAAFLSDMGAEISALEGRRDKTRDLKQAMMQELLTGRIRLVEPAIETDTKLSARVRPRRANIHFRRSVLAAEIVDRLHGEPTFGHVKLQKIIFLVEHFCEVDTGSIYHRDAAGPYDNRAIRSIDKQLQDQEWFEVQRDEGRYRYLPMRKRGEHKQYFDRYFSEARTSFERIMDTFRAVNTERCEIVATLFGAWIDLLHETTPVSDEAILNEVLNKRHESKKRIPEDRWRRALGWMRNNGFVPQERAISPSESSDQ